MRIALAQLNLHVGNIQGNTDKIICAAIHARDDLNADVVVYPELSITSYPPEDLLLRPHLHELVSQSLQQICDAVNDIDLIVGHPRLEAGQLFNSCSLISEGKTVATYDKQQLPNYLVFDEKRYFTAATAPIVVDIKGIPVALAICEDMWIAGTGNQVRQAGGKLLISINASPYHKDKSTERLAAIKQNVIDSQMPAVFVNLVGGQDELIFDGESLVLDANGEPCFTAPKFEEGIFVVDMSGNNQNINQISHQYSAPEKADQPEVTIYQALVLGVRDYVTKNGFKGAVLGLSGGIDSALTLTIAVDALGKENVEAILMPSRYTSDMSNEDAVLEAEALGVKYHVVPIKKPFDAFTESLGENMPDVFTNSKKDTTEENIQARCRGVILMAISNKTGKILLTTGNKSEMAVGYATLYGDMNGGFAPIKDISKLLVYRLSEWRNTHNPDGSKSNGLVIPQRVIDRPPSAELAPDQKDQDSLPPYEILDPILEAYIERDETPKQLIAEGYDREIVERVVMLVDRNEYKRRQAAPGVRITKRAFGRDRRYPITSGYREF